MSFMIYDAETQNHKSYRRVANPFDSRNWVVAHGWCINTERAKGIYCPDPTTVDESGFVIPDDVTVIVGHNIKFDLLHLWKSKTLIKFIERGGKIWCTQLAEYYLEGQTEKYQMCSLDSISEKYDGTLKIDEVKALWKAGVLTADISEELLMEYLLDGDIPNTLKVFLGQLQRATKSKQIKMISTRMDSLLFTTECEYNGLHVDKELGYTQSRALQEQLGALREQLNESLPPMPKELLDNWSWSARHAMSALLYGGGIRYERWTAHLDENDNHIYTQVTEKWPIFNSTWVSPSECTTRDGKLYHVSGDGVDAVCTPQDTYKSGKKQGEAKFRNVKVNGVIKGAQQKYIHKFNQLIVPDPSWQGNEYLPDGTPVYSTGGEVLESLAALTSDPDSVPALLGKVVKLSKDLNTYYISEDGESGMLLCVDDDDIIHHSIHHCKTKTTRQSASDPNCQNLPRKDKSDVKRMFTSRFENGKTGEVDYSQLEVVIQAWLTGDASMIRDVNLGIDFHCKRLAVKLHQEYEHVLHMAKVLGDTYYVDQRTGAKSISFQMAYGAGVKAIAADLGMPTDEVQAIVDAENVLYPDVAKFYDELGRTVEQSSKADGHTRSEPHPTMAGKWRSFRVGDWSGPTGTLYRWRQWDAPDWLQKRGTLMTFSPTERKNWPVQGTGGEVMQMAQGILFRYFVEKGWWSNGKHNVLLTNTVHDCVWLDMEEQYVTEVINAVLQIMIAAPQFFEHRYKINVPVKFSAEAEVGCDMYDMNHFTASSASEYAVNINQLCTKYL